MPAVLAMLNAQFWKTLAWYEALNNVHVVDRSESGALVRMGSPLHYGLFGISGPVFLPGRLEDTLLEATGIDVEDLDQLHDFNLLTHEADQINAERRGLGSKVTLWPTLGVQPGNFTQACSDRGIQSCPETMQPRDMEDADRRLLARSFPEWDADNLAERVEILHELLHRPLKPAQLKRVIFFHCQCGCDRTGEMAAAYSMRYLNRSFTEMYRENTRFAGRNTLYENQVAAQWYCEHLSSKGLYSHNDCGNCEPFRCAQTGSPMWLEFQRRLQQWSPMCIVVVLFSLWACFHPRKIRREVQIAGGHKRLLPDV